MEAFIVENYLAGRSLRELSDLTDRSFSAVRNILAKHHVHRRGTGAAVLDESRSQTRRHIAGREAERNGGELS
ncbi:hypothetical protein SAMN05660209_03292 [Geodermatophilus africanus]|uniref:Helix-turn-helix domain-containing protein n=1 Tax=Geodermatophilus africanus TaxID=1137993 RepID=A0A1H3LCG7_9ACTN|nr:hypothetical protein SAMN05660209_03292 [Geodermatophilus africanus]